MSLMFHLTIVRLILLLTSSLSLKALRSFNLNSQSKNVLNYTAICVFKQFHYKLWHRIRFSSIYHMPSPHLVLV